MKKGRLQLSAAVLALSVTGCAITGGQGSADRGRKTFDSMRAAVTEASAKAADAVVLVKLVGMKGGDRTLVLSGGALRQQDSGEKTLTGIVLTEDGYIAVPQKIAPNDVTRIEVWVGDIECPARVVKSDDQLDMTIVKMDFEEPLKVLKTDVSEDLAPGDWCVAVQPTDEELDFERFTSLAMCRGTVAGRYREFLLDGSIGGMPGTPVFSMSGVPAGILYRPGRALALNDIREDLLALLDDARGVKSADEEAKQKAWFGALLMAINKEYALKHGLNKSAIWVRYVMKDGPAGKAGIQAGDLIVKVNGSDMRLTGSRAYGFFMKALYPKVDKPFTVTVLRDGKELELAGSFTKKPEEETVRADDLGVTVKRIDDSDVAGKNLFVSEGVFVTDVKRGSAAAVGSNMRNSLLERGDIITAVNHTVTPDLKTFSAVLEEIRREQPGIVLVSYVRGRTTGFAALNLKIGDNGNEGDGQ